MKILVLAAHPDDEVLGCGATMARLQTEHRVDVVILGEGLSSREAARADVSREELAALRADALAAGARLGAHSVNFGGLPDNRFDELPLLDVVKHVERWIEQFAPDVIYTHHPGDVNIDHNVTYRSVLTATRPGAAPHTVGDILAFEIPSSTEWAFQSLPPAFRPNVFVDASATIERKIEAMQCYRTERREAPHPRSPEALRAIARTRGAAAGFMFAEAFELIRSLRV